MALLSLSDLIRIALTCGWTSISVSSAQHLVSWNVVDCCRIHALTKTSTRRPDIALITYSVCRYWTMKARSLASLRLSTKCPHTRQNSPLQTRRSLLIRTQNLFMFLQFYPRGASSARVIAMIARPSVCLSVCLSHAGIVSKRLNVGSRKQHHVIAQGIYFSDAKIRWWTTPPSS